MLPWHLWTVYETTPTYHSFHVAVKGQLSGVSFLLPYEIELSVLQVSTTISIPPRLGQSLISSGLWQSDFFYDLPTSHLLGAILSLTSISLTKTFTGGHSGRYSLGEWLCRKVGHNLRPQWIHKREAITP